MGALLSSNFIKLESKRMELGLTQQELCAFLGLHCNTYRRIKKSTNMPSAISSLLNAVICGLCDNLLLEFQMFCHTSTTAAQQELGKSLRKLWHTFFLANGRKDIQDSFSQKVLQAAANAYLNLQK